MTDVIIEFAGWGRLGWGDEAWSSGLQAAEATGEVGDVTIFAIINTLVNVTGVASTVLGGDVTTGFGKSVSVTGLAANARSGASLIWGAVVPNQTTTWTEISP
jgi:hypothetical protein